MANNNNKNKVSIDSETSKDNPRPAVHNVDINPSPDQRAPMNIQPHGDYMLNFQEITLSALKREDTIYQGLIFWYIDVQKLCPILSNNKGESKLYGRRKQNNNGKSAVRFTRLYLVNQVHSTYAEEEKKVSYLMKERTMNMNLWKHVK